MKFKPGDKVEVVGEVPPIFTVLTGIASGIQGEVVRECTCEIFKLLINGFHATRVHFPDIGKGCVPTAVLRLVPGDENKLADYTWEPSNVATN